MGLMDKFKNLFTDEEYEDEEELEEPVKIKEIKKEEPKKEENKLPTFMREKIEKEKEEQRKETKKQENINSVSDFSINRDSINRELINNMVDNKKEEKTNNISSSPVENNNNFKFPIAFEESDFTDISRVSRQAMRTKKTYQQEKTPVKPAPEKSTPKKETKVSGLYKEKKKTKEEEKRFKATPIISPIYGVLDKNYKKEELEPITGDNYELQRPSKNIDFDSVRKKAYGSLAEDIKANLMCENCEYLKKAKACKKEVGEDNLMYEALCEKKHSRNHSNEQLDENSYNDITLDEATENYFDYGVEYEKMPESKVSPLKEKVKIMDHTKEDIQVNTKEKSNKIPPVKSSINLLSTLKKSMGDEENGNNTNETPKQKDLELTDDLFNLIDSMYDEGKD